MAQKVGNETLNCLRESPTRLQKVVRRRVRIIMVCAFRAGRRLGLSGGRAIEVRRDALARLVTGDAGIAC